MVIRIPKIEILKMDDVAGWMLFGYLCEPIINACLQKILGIVGLDYYSKVFAIIIILLPYLILCLLKRKILVVDFWLLYMSVSLFFLITYLVHPEYKYWYAREDYGVVSYVLRPDNGLFIYLILRLMSKPSMIIKYIKYSGWFMYLWYGRQFLQAHARGYWIDTSVHGYANHVSYNLSLGYNILLFVLVFLFCWLDRKKTSDFIGASVGVVLTLLAGSRGPFLDIAIFILLYIGFKYSESKKKGKFLLFASIFTIIGIIVLPYILTILADLLENYGLSSRFITKLVNGDIMDDAGRSKIWLAALNMIRKQPFGYGAMGSRHVISKYIYVAHPHQIFLEILIDFGVFWGTIIIVFLAMVSVRALCMKGMEDWKELFIIFFSRACQLLVSLTFWHSIGLWGMLAIYICMCKMKKVWRKNGVENIQYCYDVRRDKI